MLAKIDAIKQSPVEKITLLATHMFCAIKRIPITTICFLNTDTVKIYTPVGLTQDSTPLTLQAIRRVAYVVYICN